MCRLDDEARGRGVVTHSSGNHGQAVALSGQLLGIKTTVVMPQNAPVRKRAATERYGATVVDYDPAVAKRENISAELAREHGYSLIPPFDHPHVIAGQGTAALELLADSGALDMLLVPCGGGLLGGNAISTRHLQPDCRIIGVEPALADDATRSFRTGTLQRVDNPQTIADGTRTESLGQITFPLIQKLVDDFCTVTEEAIVEAVRYLFHELKIVVEPSGALGVAALLSQAVPAAGRIGVIVSGGNIDGETIAAILNT
jgi:threonine dehydratase